jgi:hypothetical protein
VIEPYVSHVGFVSNQAGSNSAVMNMTMSQYQQQRRDHLAKTAALLTTSNGTTGNGATSDRLGTR